MRTSGEKLINIICRRLDDEGLLYYDRNILHALKNMTSMELNQAIAFGDVLEWHNARIKSKQEKNQNEFRRKSSVST